MFALQSGGGPALNKSGLVDNDLGMIPAQTQLQTALAINLGAEGKAVSWNIVSSCPQFLNIFYFSCLSCPCG